MLGFLRRQQLLVAVAAALILVCFFAQNTQEQDVQNLKRMLEDINKKLEKMNVDARSNAGLPSSEEKDEGEEEEGEIDVGGVVSGDEDVVNGRLLTSKGVPVKVVIMLGSTARSGTSLFGELLSQQKDSLYLFEPELFVRQHSGQKVTQELGMKHMRDMIHCRFDKDFITFLHRRSSPFNIFRHAVTKTNCRNWDTCLTIPRLTGACRAEPTRIMKVIRLRVVWMKELLDDPRYDVKVVHLVRDPRGSLYSMAKLHLHKLMPEYHCPLIYDDLVNGPKFMAEYPGRVISVTYEQFCLDPVGTATRVWRMLSGDEGASIPAMWSEYIEKHVHRTSTRRIAAYGTFRNSAEQYQSWRDNITEIALTSIEEHCQPALELLGYNVFGDLKTTRNLSVSLFAN
ncbi:carbohydrate sulfotransferase 1 isoform X1 [Penaeus vannamei]|uniref:carbohydrate sulfotransferase 1 isoform X1 n=2 Tax=Penaeus vannamei TaxID=6689 RepID=UPI00387F580F